MVWPQWSGDMLGINSGFGDTSVRSHIELVPLSIWGVKHGLTVDWQWIGSGVAMDWVRSSLTRPQQDWWHSVQ